MATRSERSGGQVAVAALLVAVLLVMGCASTQPADRGVMSSPGTAALACGLGGAATGAIIGGAAGRGRGALIGAVAGALLGGTACFAIAEYQSRQVRGYEETQQAVAYRPAQGDVVQITSYELAPAAVMPGGQVAFHATYHVMTPTPDQDVPITETRTLAVRDPATSQFRELGRAPAQVTVKPGTRQSDGKIPVGSGVAEGQYQLVFEVSKNGVKDTKVLPITVTRDQALLSAPAGQVARVRAPASGAADPPLASLGEKDPRPAPPAGGPAVAAARPTYFVASRVVGRGSLRDGPGRAFRVVGEIQAGERFLIVERRMPDGESTPWYRLRLDSGAEAWVAGALGDEVPE